LSPVKNFSRKRIDMNANFERRHLLLFCWMRIAALYLLPVMALSIVIIPSASRAECPCVPCVPGSGYESCNRGYLVCAAHLCGSGNSASTFPIRRARKPSAIATSNPSPPATKIKSLMEPAKASLPPSPTSTSSAPVQNAPVAGSPPVSNASAVIAAPTSGPPTLLSNPTEKRVALVIGNSTYINIPRLTNPKNDAKLIADTLTLLGFQLIGGGPQLDLDKIGIDRVVQKFGAELRGADVGLFYYAGHGVQVHGSNFLIPIDANPTHEADADFQMLDTNLVLRQMADAGTKMNLVLLDACRNNPLVGRGLRSAGGGLAQMQAPEGTLISFATQPGNTALDGDSDSPYTKALAEQMRKPGVDVFNTFNGVGLDVSRVTGGMQQPWLSVSPLKGSFYFAGK
jgi:Caspase domain